MIFKIETRRFKVIDIRETKIVTGIDVKSTIELIAQANIGACTLENLCKFRWLVYGTETLCLPPVFKNIKSLSLLEKDLLRCGLDEILFSANASKRAQIGGPAE